MHCDSFLYTGQQSRDADAIAINGLGIPGIHLMKNAGRAAFGLLRCKFPDASKIGIVCGNGNNAGDGYIVAGLALQQGLSTFLVQVDNADALKGDAALARDWATTAGVKVYTFHDQGSLSELQHCDVIVDAMLGTGISGAVRTNFQTCIDTLNSGDVPVLAIDLPSGLNPDTGNVEGSVVRADCSISFIVRKRGLYSAEGPACSGEVHFDTLGLPQKALGERMLKAGISGVRVLDWKNLASDVPCRAYAANTSKNTYGHVLIVGGDVGMGGAVCLAAQAALRCGAGLVSVVTRSVHVGGILARQPELMVLGMDEAESWGPEKTARLKALLKRCSTVVIGPGLGIRDWGQSLLKMVLQHNKPTVLDADALNILATKPALVTQFASNSARILTPHPGEAGRLLGISSKKVQADRFNSIATLSRLHACDVILKGAGSLVCSKGNDTGLCMHGNAGMATAGMGDILSGVAGAFLGFGMPVSKAARAAVCFHSAAADLTVEREGIAGLVASDVLPGLRELINR